MLPGAGATDNAAFTITNGNELHLIGSADFETKASYSILISVTDAGGASHEEVKTISITNRSPEVVNGTSAAEILKGGSDRDQIYGFAGNDQLLGMSGSDTLTGGLGRDTLNGGSDTGVRDVFDFNLVSETGKTAATRDVIIGFQHGIDDIDLSTIDASTKKGGNQAFKFIDVAGFHRVAGELHVVTIGANKVVEGDINGDGKADFQIQVNGNVTLTAGDFIL